MEITGTHRTGTYATHWETTMPDGGVEAAIEAIRGALPRALRGRATTTFGADTPQDWERPIVGDAPFWEVRTDLHDKGWGPVAGILRPQPDGRLTWAAWTPYAEGDEGGWPKPGLWSSRPAPIVPPTTWEAAASRDITAAALHDLAAHAVAPHEIRSDGVIWHGGTQIRPLDDADDLRGAAAALAAGLEAAIWRECTEHALHALSIIGVDVDVDAETLAAAQEVTMTGEGGTLVMTLERCGRAWNGTPTKPRVRLEMTTDAHGEERTEVRSGALWEKTRARGHTYLIFWPGEIAGEPPRQQGVEITWR